MRVLAPREDRSPALPSAFSQVKIFEWKLAYRCSSHIANLCPRRRDFEEGAQEVTKSMKESILARFGQHAVFYVKAHGGELARLCAMGGDENRFTR